MDGDWAAAEAAWAAAEAEADGGGAASRPTKRPRATSDDAEEGARGAWAGASAPPLAGVCIVVSGIVNPERGELRDLAVGLGAEYRGNWEPGCATHLLAPFDGTESGGRPTPKSVAARKSGGFVVKPAWLRACAEAGRRVDEAGFLLGDKGAAISLLDSSSDSDEEAQSPPTKKVKAPTPPAAAAAAAAPGRPARSVVRLVPVSLVAESSDGSGAESDETVDLGDDEPPQTLEDGNPAAASGGDVPPLRPACRSYNPGSDDIVFMLLDTTHDDATLTLYGVTEHGESVIVIVEGFRPYFYIRAPKDTSVDEFATELRGKMRGKGGE